MNLQENKTDKGNTDDYKDKTKMNRLNLFRCKLVPIGKERTTELKDTKVSKDAKIFPIVPHIMNFDGCSKGNPGLAGIGAVIYYEEQEIWGSCKFIGIKTNNYSEYSALIFGLQEALRLGIECLCVLGDSLLVINQINGIFRVKSEDLLELYEEAVRLKKLFKYIEFNHVYREKNKRADELSNLGLLEQSIKEVPLTKVSFKDDDDSIEVVLLDEIPMKRPSKRLAKLTATKIDSFFPIITNKIIANKTIKTIKTITKKQPDKLTSIL